MKNQKAIFFAVLAVCAGVTAFSLYRYIVTQKDNYGLAAHVDNLSSEIASLEAEKQGLVTDLNTERQLKRAFEQESALAKSTLQETQEQVAKFEVQFQESQKLVEGLNSQIAVVKAENTALRDEIQNLQLDVSQTRADNEALTMRMSSIAELKKAIRELKKKMRMAKVTVTNRLSQEERLLGNYGFIIRDGKPTFPGKVKIEVEPLP